MTKTLEALEHERARAQLAADAAEVRVAWGGLAADAAEVRGPRPAGRRRGRGAWPAPS